MTRLPRKKKKRLKKEANQVMFFIGEFCKDDFEFTETENGGEIKIIHPPIWKEPRRLGIMEYKFTKE